MDSALHWALAALAVGALPLCAETAASLGERIRDIALDTEACYRVRDINFQKGDASIYLTDGFLIFGKPVNGRIVLAAFQAIENIDDGEILLRPPDRGERASLAAYTGSPNLSEHFRTAIFVFTDSTGDDLLKELKDLPTSKRSVDMGLVVSSNVGSIARNLLRSFDVRIVHDLLSGAPADGVFYAALSGQKLGNFDFYYDPMSAEPVTLGQVRSTPDGSVFDVWASFQTRARARTGEAPPALGSVSNYRIDATITPDLRLSATTKLTFTPARETRGVIGFEIAPQMEIAAAKVDGVDVEIYRQPSLRSGLIGGRRNDPFLVVLPAPLTPGKAYDIEVQHQGSVITDAGNNVYYVGARTNWYPMRGLEHANYDLTFRVPKALTLVATGEPVSETEEGDTRVIRRRSSTPIRIAGFNLGVYERVTVSRGGLNVEVVANKQAEAALMPRAPMLVVAQPQFTTRGPVRRAGELVAVATPPLPPPDSKARLSDLANEVSTSMEWMSRQFGPPPLKTLTVSPIPGSFGQGFPGLLYLSTLAFLAESDRARLARTDSLQTFYSEILHTHEAAHQWWGNLVGAATYHDDWVQEALANYTALLWLERKKGAKELENLLTEYRANLLRPHADRNPIESAGPITWGSRLRTETVPDPWRVITYDKGSWIMHMLRRRMGDAQFLKMLGELRNRYQYKTMTTAQFRDHAAEFMPPSDPDRQLENFFDNWVYGTGIPTLSLTQVFKGAGAQRSMTVTLRQSGVADEFGIDVPVEVRLAGQKSPQVKWLRTSAEPVSFTMRIGAAQPKVELAPGLGVLATKK